MSYDKDKLIGILVFALKDLTADCVNKKDILKPPKLGVLFSAEAAIRMAEHPLDYTHLKLINDTNL